MTSFTPLPHIHPRVVELFAREQLTQRTAAWYARRQTLVTASDAPAALGVKPYASYAGNPRADALRKKVSGSFRGNMFCAHGIRLEDAARDLAAEALGETIFDAGLVIHKDLPWLGASPDGITASGKCVEIKCPMMRAIVPGKTPAHYYPQVQVQMEVCDLDQTIWIEYKPPELTESGECFISMHIVERDREWFKRNKGALYSFFLDYQAARGETPAEPEPLPACSIVDDLYDTL